MATQSIGLIIVLRPQIARKRDSLTYYAKFLPISCMIKARMSTTNNNINNE